MKSAICWFLTVCCLACVNSKAEISGANYQRAHDFHKLAEGKVFRDRVQPHWNTNNSSFWYQIATGPDTSEFISVDVEKGIRAPAFDPARLAQALNAVGITNAIPSRLSLSHLNIFEKTLRFTVDGKGWTCDLGTYTLTPSASTPEAALPNLDPKDIPHASYRTGPETTVTFVNHTPEPVDLLWLSTEGELSSYGKIAPGNRRSQHTFAGHIWIAKNKENKTLLAYEAEETDEAIEITTKPTGKFSHPPHRHHGQDHQQNGTSPDGRWIVFIRENNVYLRKQGETNEILLSKDGTSEDSYGEPFSWSPDSQKLVVLRTRKGDDRKLTLVESSPKDQLQPKIRVIDYPKPGDKLPTPKPQLFDIATAKQIPVKDDLFSNPFDLGDIRWAPDSTRFTFVYNQRGHQVLRIIAINASTGEASAIVDEHSNTFIDYSGKQFTEYLPDTGELIWMSERDGWNHLYLYDAKTGQVKNQITKGEWVVRNVEKVDKEKRQIWFRAGGIIAGQDPYYLHYCRINFDGSGLIVMTQGDGTHNIEYSPDQRCFIDTYSRVDFPPVTELRKTADGSLICLLERADWSALLQAGWRVPERFCAKGRDGQTDIYGVIMTPTDFDPSKHYPVIECIYAGPQDSFVPKRFSSFHPMQELAELGFVVVQIDGMGTSNRSKKFHDVCWKNLVDAGFPDRILWMKAAAATRPWMDLTRVGIYGTSAGGQNALGGLLTHGEFYKAGVADCGCHDNRMDKIWWNEQWMGWPIGPHYEEQSNVTLAHQLTGKLLLMVGELDSNVDPSSTMQVVNALIKADKDFEMLVVPGAGHGVAGSPYGKKRLQEFFVRNLLQSTSSH